MKLIIASNNQHKIKEIKEILSSEFEEILSLREAGILHETVEDGNTFMENARKKAREIADISGCAALADDSGICVDALGGAPGVFSARFSGGTDEDNNDLLLKRLEGGEDRRAHYTCAMVIAYPDGSSLEYEGYFHGRITEKRIGTGGFGYDPLFMPDGYGVTVGEMSDAEKNRISHRAAALRGILELMKNRG